MRGLSKCFFRERFVKVFEFFRFVSLMATAVSVLQRAQ